MWRKTSRWQNTLRKEQRHFPRPIPSSSGLVMRSPPGPKRRPCPSIRATRADSRPRLVLRLNKAPLRSRKSAVDCFSFRFDYKLFLMSLGSIFHFLLSSPYFCWRRLDFYARFSLLRVHAQAFAHSPFHQGLWLFLGLVGLNLNIVLPDSTSASSKTRHLSFTFLYDHIWSGVSSQPLRSILAIFAHRNAICLGLWGRHLRSQLVINRWSLDMNGPVRMYLLGAQVWRMSALNQLLKSRHW